MRFDILTLFPEPVEAMMHSSILGRAQKILLYLQPLIVPQPDGVGQLGLSAGQLIEIPGGFHVCPDCMQKSFHATGAGIPDWPEYEHG